MPVQSPVEFRAVNTAPDSKNRIHSDDGASEYGFKGGLVPGIATFSYACEALRWTQGDQWTDHGYVNIGYRNPVYDGDLIQVAVDTSAAESGAVRVTNQAGQRCAEGVFAAGATGSFSESDEQLPEVPLPASILPLTGANLIAAEQLGSVPVVLDAAECAEYLVMLGLDPAFYLEHRVAQLGFLARQYTRLIAATFERVGPAIHARTELLVVRPPHFGETISVRGRVDRAFRRKGHGYWTFEMAWVDADGRTCLRAMHTGIWDVKKRTAEPGTLQSSS
jgi:acyl dehydratase